MKKQDFFVTFFSLVAFYPPPPPRPVDVYDCNFNAICDIRILRAFFACLPLRA